MQVQPIFSQNFNNNNRVQTNKQNQNYKNFSQNADTISFSGVKDLVDSAREKYDSFIKLFSSGKVEISEGCADFLTTYEQKEQAIRDKYEKQIAAVKGGFFDGWTCASEKKKAKLREKMQEELKVAYSYQELFEQRERELIELKKQFRDMAAGLNFSKEVIAAFDKAQLQSLKRQEIIAQRKLLMEKKGFSKLAGYEAEKNALRLNFIDKLDDEKSGSAVSLPNAILFYGPTGCGKTTFAEAFADETGCKFIKLKCSGSQKDKERQFQEALFGTDDEPGILEKAQTLFEKTNTRTIILADEFDKFFSKDVSDKFIRGLKGLLNNCSRDNHVTFFLTTNNPQKIPYELRNSHRAGIIVNLDPPDRDNAKSVISHYVGDDAEKLDFKKILDELFKYSPDELYSNSHLKAICQIATDEIKGAGETLTTDMMLSAIESYNNSEDNPALLRITKNYLSQYEADKANIGG